MDPSNPTRGATSPTAAPRRIFLSHTSDLGKPDEPGSFVAAAVAAVLRAGHTVIDMAYFAARGDPCSPVLIGDTSRAGTCVDVVAQSDVYVDIIGLQ